ncbi:MAG: alpha-glucuronidase [Bacteroidales bacterium]|nr:alpha-glucuronidase [Bacteroidales bacterium]
MKFSTIIFSLLLLISVGCYANDGSMLWLGDMKAYNGFEKYAPQFYVIPKSNDATLKVVQKELLDACNSMFGVVPKVSNPKKINDNTFVIVNNCADDKLGKDGFIIDYSSSNNVTTIKANGNIGVLYGVYEWIKQIRCGLFKEETFTSIPKFQLRLLNHWDNPDGSVERGYAGKSIWFADGKINYVNNIETYARANASIGINGAVIDNVNADPKVLDKEILNGVKDVANILRPYGIKVYLAVNFSSPTALGKLPTSDPLDKDVIAWWNNKCKEIYTLIPDFGGFLVKANSEGLPGPMDFGRTHADGANMLADALKPFGGIVMWRAFVYSPTGDDRACQAYTEFMPLDGQFRDNVIIQIKNGPVDFQPREPFSPLFSAMNKTQMMPELQITQEYLGFSDHLCYLGTLFKEFLDYPTYKNNKTVGQIVTSGKLTAIAGVANTGNMKNWCGYVYAQSNWYVYGRLAWDPDLSVEKIADEWTMQTISTDPIVVKTSREMMMMSREAVVNYMTPLGLHHLMGWNAHYGPEPWCNIPGARADWQPPYYHKADEFGLGFNRSSTGSNAVGQYQPELTTMFDNPLSCPEEYVLWFHHLPWDYKFANGNTLWQELCARYLYGVEQVKYMQKMWNSIKSKVDDKTFKDVSFKLDVQLNEAQMWQCGCMLYFQTFSKMDFPLWMPEMKYKTIDEVNKERNRATYRDRQHD